MGFNIFGLHFSMGMNLHVQPSLVWFTQVIIAVFFMAGFLGFYQSLYQYAFMQKHSYRHQGIARLSLLLMSVGTATLLHLMGFFATNTAILLHNMALFLFILPFLNGALHQLEDAVRLIAIIIFWCVSHWGVYGQPQFWVSLILLAIGIIVTQKYNHQIRDSMWKSLTTFSAIAVVYWLSLPLRATGYEMTILLVHAIGMFLAMSTVAFWFWRHESIEAGRNKELTRMVNYDELTNSQPYEVYQREVTNMFAQAQAQHVALTLVAFDIDHFKQVNDHYGRLAGNAVLNAAADKLTEILKMYDLDHRFYRIGGEEFNAVFFEQTPKEVAPVVTKCWDIIRKTRFKAQKFEVPITVSVGITNAKASDLTIDAMYKRADDNVYLSKHAGGDTITIDGETMHHDNQDLSSTYAFFAQGIMHPDSSGTIQSSSRWCNELLLRMYDHEHDRWILPEMFELSPKTQIELIKKVLAQSNTKQVAVNLTQTQFCSELVAKTLTKFRNSPDGPDDLTVEIVDVPDMKITRNITAIYRAGGVHINIDDVGSDNSYELVQNLLPYVDGVKFALQNLRKNNTAEALQERVKFWVDVAKRNNLNFILEGVETLEEVQLAYDQLGIQFFQGYYFNKPSLPTK